jgi:hypothetical protein
MKRKIGNHFGDPTASYLVDPSIQKKNSYLVDPATGWIQEFQTQIHSGGKPKLRVKYKKQGRNYMSYD